MEDVHPIVPNLYTYLTGIPRIPSTILGRSKRFYIDLKDSFFCIHLDPQPQELFAFEWQDPGLLVRTQWSWTVLP